MKQASLLILSVFFFLFCSQLTSPVAEPIVLRKLPHDRRAFTQGLLLHDKILYESSGLFGKSSLRSLSEKNGELLAQRRLPEKYFGEGLALLDNNLYQLTWKSGIVRIYSLPQMDFAGSLSYPGEGWGLAVVGDNFVMSNGGPALHVMTKKFRLVKKIPVRHRDKSVKFW